MKYQIKEIENKKVWNDFVKKQKYVNILSSWEWQEFERDLVEQVYSYGIYDKKNLKGVFAFKVCKNRKGVYLFLRHSIFVDWDDSNLLSEMFFFLEGECKRFGASFFRISPTLLSSQEFKQLFEDLGFKRSFIQHVDGQHTSILDLENDLNEILQNMRKNARYLVRKVEKMGVEIIRVQNNDFLDVFEDIYNETVQRQCWNAFDFEYVKNQYKFLASRELSNMFVARYEGEVLAVAIFTHFGKQVIYHHSGSVPVKDIPANYLLIWEAIKYYKGLGVKEFNFFGVVGKDETNHPWYGLSLFKRGFGGFDREFIGNYDYSVTPKYLLFGILERLAQLL